MITITTIIISQLPDKMFSYALLCSISLDMVLFLYFYNLIENFRKATKRKHASEIEKYKERIESNQKAVDFYKNKLTAIQKKQDKAVGHEVVIQELEAKHQENEKAISVYKNLIKNYENKIYKMKKQQRQYEIYKPKTKHK